MMTVLSLDLETYSPQDLTKVGVYRYAEDPEFRILMIAYAVDDGPVQILDLENGSGFGGGFQYFERALQDPNIIKTAYNAAFERTCLRQFFGKPMPPEQWRCTAVHAATLGLPRSLADAAKALGLPQDKQKMTAGRALIRYFSMPCKPTKSNGGRERNLPHHDPDKWSLFMEYCKQDVEVERAIRKKCEKFPVPEEEQRLWCLDQKINDHGVLVDRRLVQSAIQIDQQVREELEDEAVRLTGLDNPNSVAQLKGWIEEAEGVEIESLNKAALKDLKADTDDDTVARVLSIRQELGKTSVSKYQALDRAMQQDDRIRGILLFYGANRTGRWAGRIFQPQNLPQNKLVDLDLARGLVRSGDREAVEMLYGNVSDTLSQLIRTALIAPEGKTFLVADFSAIEARVIAWLAGEQWRLDVFETHGKIYEASASQMFGVPLDRIKKGNPEYALRQKGKIAELACIAEGQPVLTDRGLVPIEEVTTAHRVWDGLEWVQHDGVICKGSREVIEYDGLTATPDHIVWVEGQPKPVRFGDAASRGARLLRSGHSRTAIRLGKDRQPAETMERTVEPLQGSDRVPGLRSTPVDISGESAPRHLEGLPDLLTAETDTEVAGQEADGCETALHEPEGRRIQELRRPGDSVRVRLGSGGRAVDGREPGASGPGLRDRPDRRERELCSRKSALGNAPRELPESTQVYDILNAGPRNRYTVADVLVHNCGYGGSVGALKAMGALDMGLNEEDLQPLIKQWRAANPAITDLWWSVDRAAMEAVREKTVQETHGITFQVESGILFVTLPNGRRLAYVRPRIEPDPRFGKEKLTYEGVEQGKNKWGRIDTYGPKLVENIVQAIARDCLAYTMTELDREGYQIAMHVHDEVIIEGTAGDLRDVEEIMARVPPWAEGLPLRADGYECTYYRKD